MPDEPRDDAWIEKVVAIAGHLGFNRMRLRWKLIRWQDHRQKAANLREQDRRRIHYQHKTCPECTAVQDRDEATCTACGAKLPARTIQVLGRLGLSAPRAVSVSTVIALALLAAYARVWVAAGGGFGSPSVRLLLEFGGRWPPRLHDEPWRLVTAVFLHAGMWHLAFNLLAIATVGPRIEELYGRATTLALFVITGALANLATVPVGHLAVGIGASGGLMGLIGVAAGYGHRSGTGAGRGLRNDMLKWSAYTMIFGVALGADNWAHLFGFVFGAAFGFGVRPATWKRVPIVVRVPVAAIGIVATIGALAIIFTRTPAPARADAVPTFELADGVVDAYVGTCRAARAGDRPGAIAAARRVLAAIGDPDAELPIDDHTVAMICGGVDSLRASCRAGTTQRAVCDAYAPVFDMLGRP